MISIRVQIASCCFVMVAVRVQNARCQLSIWKRASIRIITYLLYVLLFYDLIEVFDGAFFAFYVLA